MNKKKLRFIGIFILILSLSFPMIIVGLQDFRDINKEMTLENSQTEDILKKHPVIESIYQLYQNIPEKSEEYVIKRIGEYSEDKQAKLKEFQSYFSEEIQQLINHKVLSQELLENFDDEYVADYGTIVTYENTYYLRQVLRMWEESFKSLDFQMDPLTHKIIDFSMSDAKDIVFNDEELKTISWHMIKYLELDDIDDWVYNQYGYESNQAKLRISCEFQKRVGTNQFHISVDLLGVLSPYTFRRIVQQ